MIDPKFNTLPIDAEGDFEEGSEGSLSEARLAEKTPRSGLSINDTVASNANLSVGSRGVDTSGAAVGSGAGAGMTLTTAGDDDSPAPMIAPGSRGSGTTIRGDSVSDLTPTTRLETGPELSEATPTTRLEAGTETAGTSLFTADEIAARAHRCWHERGCPDGSPEVDWETAVDQLRRERQRAAAATA